MMKDAHSASPPFRVSVRNMDEIRELIAELHGLFFADGQTLSAVDESLNIVDEVPWLIERLRVLTDSEYAECAYWSDET